MAPKTIALHSYKGGTGKTTIITNFAAIYANEGFKVCLLDFDLFAPSLSTYFRKTSPMYINDLLSGESGLSDVLIDLTTELNLKGKLWVGLANPHKDAVQEVEVKHDMKWQLTALKRFLSVKKELFDEYQIDYMLLDTSPGIRYWSVNTLAVADTLLLLMKDSDMDIEGTRKMINDIYEQLTRFGSRYYVILNKVPSQPPPTQQNEKAWIEEIERTVGAQILGSIPCFCDIQFSRHEFLFALNKPDHLFSKRLNAISEKIKNLS